MPKAVLDSTALAALAITQAVVPTVARMVPGAKTEEEQSRRLSGPLTPPPGAFAIWGPIFLASVAYPAVSLISAARSMEAAPATAPVSGNDWLGASFTLNALWSLNAQFRRLDWVSVGLIAASAVAANVAAVRASHPDALAERSTNRTKALLAGPLAGWLTVAAPANLEATSNRSFGRPRRNVEDLRAVGLLGATTAVASAQAMSTNGNLGYAAACAWGLGGVLLKALRQKRTTVAAAAGVGLAAVAVATVLGQRRAVSRRSVAPSRMMATSTPTRPSQENRKPIALVEQMDDVGSFTV